MKNILMLVTALLFLNSSSIAQTSDSELGTQTQTTTQKSKKKKKRKAVVAPTPTPAPEIVEEAPRIKYGATAGVGIDDGNFGFGFGFRADYPVYLQNFLMRVGGETGFYYFAPSGGSVSAIPIAATATHSLGYLPGTGLDTYLRVAIGLDIAFASAGGYSETDGKFHFVIEPGFDFDHGTFFVALPFGTVAGGFLLFPTFGIHF